MKRARFTDEQIVRILQEADRSPVAEVAKRHGVSEPSIYAWRKKFGDMGTDDVRKLKALEQENNRLKKILAERDLEIEVMKELDYSAQYPRYGARRVRIFLRRDGIVLGRDRAARTGRPQGCRCPLKSPRNATVAKTDSRLWPPHQTKCGRMTLSLMVVPMGKS